jgi:ketosteroid isomerase-like protein
MKRRRVLTAAPFLIVFAGTGALADPSADIEGVKAASKAFYEAVVVVDDGTAMDKVWAHKPYVTYVGPKSTSIIVGWDAQKTYWPEFNKAFTRRTVELVGNHIHVVGDVAWEIGTEVGQAHMKDGAVRKVDWFATNVYEKIDGRWLMVSRHVQPKPQ